MGCSLISRCPQRYNNTMLKTFRRQIETNPVPLMVICFFLLSNIFIVLSSKPVTYPDSANYIIAGEPISVPINDGKVWTGETSGTLSFLGNSNRSWPNVLFYSFVSSNNERIFLQTFLYILSFSILTLVIGFLTNRKSWRSNIVHFLNLILFLSPQVFQWNNIILSESLVISLIIMDISFFILYLFRPKNVYILSLVLFLTTIITIIKLNFIFVLLFTCTILLTILWKINKSLKKLFMLGIICLFCIFYAITVNKNINDNWGVGTSPSRNTMNFFFITAEGPNTPFGSFLRDKIPLEAPSCLKDNWADDTQPFVHAGRMINICPTGVQWVNENFVSWYTKILVSNPTYALKYFKHYLPLVNSSALYYSNTYIFIPETFVHLYFVDTHVTHGFIVSSVIALFLLLSISMRLLSRSNSVRFDVIFAIFGIVSFITMTSTMLLMTAEVQRIVIPSLTLLFLCTNISIHFLISQKINSN